MCGINVCIGGKMSDVRKMYEATKHRGTSDSYRAVELNNGQLAWINYNHLPITTESKQTSFETERYIVWLNGFISNHKELAQKYQMKLNTTCDTEVLANCFELGINLHELNGFWAYVRYDKVDKMISFGTDRYGIKQLYYYTDIENQMSYYSSEVKGILAVVDNVEILGSMADNWNHALGVHATDLTIYKGIKRVPKLEFSNIIPTYDTSNEAYEEAKIELKAILKRVFERNAYNGLTGVFLSGGIDSGLIAKYVQPDYTFSVDYDNADYSEIELIKKNTQGIHYSVLMTDKNYLHFAKKAMLALDDLKAGSCYSNFAVNELASKFVKVVYSGAGGDEFFGGYPHRLNKPIEDVFRRTQYHVDVYSDNSIGKSHYEYDLMFLDAVLVVEDRMSSYHTMETRYPLLDNELVDFARSLPFEFVENKRILKDVCGLHNDVIQGKKRGFSNPHFTNDKWVDFALLNLRK